MPPASFRLAAALACLGLLVAAPALAQTTAAPIPAYDGLKKTVAVDPFTTTESVGAGTTGGMAVTPDGMTALLTDALVRDGRFVVVERQSLSTLQTEQSLTQSGAVTAETGAAPGAMIGASAIVRGSVTRFEPAASGASLGVGGLPLGSLFATKAEVKNQRMMMEVTLRLVDTTTGQVVSTAKAQGFGSSTSTSASLVDSRTGASMDADAFKESSAGKAGADAIAKAVQQIASDMRNVPWSALVVDSDGAKVYVNAGANCNVQPGMALQVYRRGKVLTDPQTGEVLDIELEPVGQIRIDAVRDRVSTATVISGQPMRGDILKTN